MITQPRSIPTQMSAQEVMSRARALAPLIGERVASAEAARRQSDETIQAIVDSGLVRVLLPKRWGGYELPFDTLVDSVLEIAKIDGSAGWCYSFLLIHAWFLAQFPDAAQRDVWDSNPDAALATSLAPAGRFTKVDGGYVLNGRWAWSSGVDYCSWNMLAALPVTMDGPPRVFLLPRSDYTILDTWFVAGQKASGSKDVAVQDAFIPEHRVALLSAMVRGQAASFSLNTGPLYTLPLLAAFPTALTSPIVGAAQGAYQTWHQTIKGKFTGLSHEQVVVLPQQQIRLAEIAAELDSAELLLRRNLDVIRNGGPLDPALYARSRRDYAYIARLCIEVVEKLYINSGGGANYETSPMQRYWRDVHAMGVHAALNFDTAGEAFGRATLGLPSNSHDAFAI